MFKEKKLKKILILFSIIFFSSFSYADEIFLSLKKDKVNVMYGPSFKSPIKYVYKKLNLPIKQIDTKENFRRIIDFKNNSGWIHVSQLKRVNSVIPLKDKILYKKPSYFSNPIAKIKKGRVLVILKCEDNWCKITTQEFKGWITNNDVWGKNN